MESLYGELGVIAMRGCEGFVIDRLACLLSVVLDVVVANLRGEDALIDAETLCCGLFPACRSLVPFPFLTCNYSIHL